MKNFLLLSLLLTLASNPTAWAQKIPGASPEKHIRFLASDELMGRMTGTAGNNQAADYIAAHFKKQGLMPVPGTEGYFQKVYLQKTTPPQSASITLNEQIFRLSEHFIVLQGAAIDQELPWVFAHYGWEDDTRNDYANLDVKGKVVICKMGASDETDPREALQLIRLKRDLALKNGAAALIEIYNAPYPWPIISRYFGGSSQYELAEEENAASALSFLWLNDPEKTLTSALETQKQGTLRLQSGGMLIEKVASQNVIGMLEGKDPLLKKEYIFLSAHYDHVGGGTNTGSGGAMTPEDSIYNGARDNAMGTTAVLEAAAYFAKKRPARSLVFIAYTGEELGLLGSKYYAQNPLIPFKDVVYNFNCDGAGYNDKTKVTVIGLERTNAQALILQGCKENGLEAIVDPVPEQNLFDRSDNVSFAEKGVPAPTFAPGLTAFDEAIQQYYHQVADDADSLDFVYVAQYANAYVRSAELIANFKEKFKWAEGDKYEKAYQSLYGTN
ncbi:MAG: M20/M25/M40 family metallo-hydrolase [Microscillaceae bacterium]|nr:M20/M25/M40 family metallo-hydrolase [Microscillaceae bacterium]